MAIKSVLIEDTEHCWLCGDSRNVEGHHAIHGQGRRKVADKYGFIIPLCHRCHMHLHDTGEFDLFFKTFAQKYYEKHIGTREQFREDFGKSWL